MAAPNSHPQPPIGLQPPTTPEKLAIASRNEGESVLDQIHRAVSQRGCFPWVGGNPRVAVNGIGNLPVAGAR